MIRQRVPALFLVLLILGTAISSRAQKSLAGYWQGAFVRDGAVQSVEVSFTSSGDTLSGTYAIPELSLNEEPITEIKVTDSTLQCHFLYGVFTLIRHNDIDELTGGNDKWNPPVRLHLKRVSLAPLPFFSREDISINSDHITIAGTLYKPSGSGPFPLALIIPGSGDQGRQTWEYRSNVYGLLKRGIAAFIYDKRGIGGSTGSLAAADFHDQAKDVRQMIDTLKRRSDIISTKVGIYGVSQGGWIAAIAARKWKDISFVILLEGPAVSLEEQEINSVEYSMRADGFSPRAIDSAVTYTRLYFESIKSTKKWSNFILWIPSVDHAKWRPYVQRPVRYNDIDMVWWRTNAYDPAEDLSDVRCPVLAIFGQNDTRVPPAANLDKMRKYLTSSEEQFSIVTVPNLGHATATTQTLLGNKWDWPNGYWVWSKRPGVIDDTIAKWITNPGKQDAAP